MNTAATFPRVHLGIWSATLATATVLFGLGHLVPAAHVELQAGVVHFAIWLGCCGSVSGLTFLYQQWKSPAPKKPE